MSNLKFSEGKYENRLVFDIIEEDPAYCHFLIYQSKNYIPKDIKDLLLNKFKNKDDYYMSYGPFKKKTLKWILNNEPEYIDFLKNDKFVQTKCFKLLQKINEL